MYRYHRLFSPNERSAFWAAQADMERLLWSCPGTVTGVPAVPGYERSLRTIVLPRGGLVTVHVLARHRVSRLLTVVMDGSFEGMEEYFFRHSFTEGEVKTLPEEFSGVNPVNFGDLVAPGGEVAFIASISPRAAGATQVGGTATH